MPVSHYERLVLDIYAFSGQKRFSDVWHGGEPLLAGIDYFAEICAVQKVLSDKYGLAFQDNVQTNATLIDDAWATFFEKQKIHVGVSLDGPREIHNLHRKNFAGVGSFDDAIRGINILKEHGFHPGVICVVNKDNISKPDELFEFFYSNGLPFKANDCTKSVSGNDDGLQVEPESFSQFLLRIFDLWIERNDPNFNVAPLNNYVRSLMGYPTNVCKLSGCCQQHLTFDVNGDVYPCDGYLDEALVLGNFLKQSVSDIVGQKSFTQRYVTDRVKVIQNCGSCNWSPVCNGYCMRQWEDTCSGKRVEKATCDSLICLWAGLSSRLEKLGYQPKYLEKGG